MSKKYVIEIKSEYEDTIRGIMVLGAKDSNLYMDAIAVEDMEELTADYINEHYGSLQDDAYRRGLEDGKQTAVGAAELREKLEYQKGFKDGKAVHEKGCDGCEFESRTNPDAPCLYCSNNFKNLWRSKKPIDDKIEVGDVVTIKHIKNSDKHSFVVTRVSDQSVWGVDEDGGWNYWAINEVIKTDKHYDIDKILEEIKGDNDK